MAVTARTWVPGELLTAVKMYTLRDDLLELDAVAGISSVQYGVVSIPDGQTTGTATITAVDIAKTVVTYLGATIAIAVDRSPRITLTNATTVTAVKSNPNDAASAGFCVLEYN